MTVYCAVPGCSSNSKTTDYTFHRFPRNVVSRARWILALRRPLRTLGSCAQVCGRHFEERMFSDRGGAGRGLVKNAAPTLYLPPKQSTPLPHNREKDTDIKKTLLLDTKSKNSLQSKLRKVVSSRPDDTKLSNKAVSREELVACRACLAPDGRLYAISGSGLEDALATFTGIAMPEAECFPRHLCAFCVTKLSKYVAFRDSCRRSTALLEALLEKGPLTMNNIKTIDRQTHKLTNGLTQANVNPLLDQIPLFKDQNDDPRQIPEYTEVEYLESDDGAEYLDVDDSDENINAIEKVEIIKVESEDENSDSNSDDDDLEYTPENDNSDFDTDSSEQTLATVKKERNTVKLSKDTVKYLKIYKNVKTKAHQYPTDIDTDTSEETIEMRKKVKMKQGLLKKNSTKTTVIEEVPYKESLAAFEKEFNCKVKLLSKEEQRQEVEERKRNNKSDYCCDLCGKGYRNENTIKTHLSYHDPSLPHECDVCRLRFRSRHKLTKHRQSHRAMFTCNECGHVSRNRTYAKDHSLMHKGRTYTCPYCRIEYSHTTSYYNHIRVQHPGENEPCDQCGETFAASRGLLMHKALMHRNDKPNANFRCIVCDGTFLNAEALQRHEELGAGVSHAALWPCAACGESYGSQAALKAHATELHQEDQHHCDECNKTFLNVESFELHMHRKHMNRRATDGPFRPRPRSVRGGGRAPPVACVCEICGKVLKNSTLLQYHMNGHLDVKPFQCHQCPKTFAHQGALNLHTRVHTGERPYQCEQCPQAFALPSNLNRHIKHVHLQQRKLVRCDACGKLMGATSLAPHVRAVHMGLPYVRRKRERNKKPARVAKS